MNQTYIYYRSRFWIEAMLKLPEVVQSDKKAETYLIPQIYTIIDATQEILYKEKDINNDRIDALWETALNSIAFYLLYNDHPYKQVDGWINQVKSIALLEIHKNDTKS